MRFSDNNYYIEKYIKCDNCGMLIYGEGLEKADHPKSIFCSLWCVEWFEAKKSLDEKVPLKDAVKFYNKFFPYLMRGMNCIKEESGPKGSIVFRRYWKSMRRMDPH